MVGKNCRGREGHPQERVQQLTVKQTVDVPEQQIMESIAEVSQIIPQERVPERVVEQQAAADTGFKGRGGLGLGV